MEVPLKAKSPLNVAFPSHGILLLESHHHETFSMQWTAHNFYKIVFVISGSGSLITRSKKWVLEQDSILFLPDKIEHRIQDDKKSPLSLFVLCVRPEKLEISLRNNPQMLHPTWRTLAENGRQIFRNMKEIVYEQTLRSPGWESSIVALTQQLFVWMIRHPENSVTQAQKSSVNRIHQWVLKMEQNFYQSATLAEAAEKTGLSERRFTQLFRIETGTTWQKYLQKLRITHAKRLLQNSPMSISSVAFASGFEDLSNFYRIFKRSVKKSPGQWKKDKTHFTG